MRERTSKKLVWHFIAGCAVFLGAVALLVYFVDPFFHYHKPWFGLKPLQYSHQYQAYGAVEHLDYDSLLLGSSVVMSINTDTLDNRLDCVTIKGVGNSASAPLLEKYLETSFEHHELKHVFYGLDVFSLYMTTAEDNLFPEEVRYLVNKNPFDDVQYLWNGTIIGEKIPDMLLASRADGFSYGLAYQINHQGDCNPDVVLENYNPTIDEVVYEEHDTYYGSEQVTANLDRIEQFVIDHPETEFDFFLPPYCITWWYRAYNQHLLDSYLYTLGQSMERLLAHENVRFYTTDFNNEDVITNLYLYQDVAHGGVTVTEQMAQEICNPDYEITLDTYQDELNHLNQILTQFRKRAETEGIGFVYDGPIQLVEQDD